jgi:hypothetical protein
MNPQLTVGYMAEQAKRDGLDRRANRASRAAEAAAGRDGRSAAGSATWVAVSRVWTLLLGRVSRAGMKSGTESVSALREVVAPRP